MAILFLIVIICVIVVIIKKFAKSKIELNDEEKLEETIPTIIHYSDEFNHEEPIKITNFNHIIAPIFICEENSDMWICPSCETENPLSKQRCCICHYIQQKGV